MRNILVTGALGQIGSELVPALRARYGAERVLASDIRLPAGDPDALGPFEVLDVTNARQVHDTVRRFDVGTVYHLAALLSATSEEKPHVAWELNMGGLYKMLEVARQAKAAVFYPSSIAAFGPTTPRRDVPQDTVQRPTTLYGVTKVAGELLADYYALRFGVDVRGLRFPGLISYTAPPGGGTPRCRCASRSRQSGPWTSSAGAPPCSPPGSGSARLRACPRPPPCSSRRPGPRRRRSRHGPGRRPS